MSRALLLVLLAAALVGCTAPETPSAADVETTQTASPEAAGPMTLQIPQLRIDAPLVELRLDADGVLVPPPVTEPDVVGWYAEGVVPGAPGPALIAGHVSGRPVGTDYSVPGIFAHLADLKPGAQITIVRSGETTVFEVYRQASYRKDAFPSDAVYGDTDGPELRLVTCGGTFDPAARSYEEDVVIFARPLTSD